LKSNCSLDLPHKISLLRDGLAGSVSILETAMRLTDKTSGISRRAILLSAATIPAFAGISQIAAAERVDAAENSSAEYAPVKTAVDAYVYLYPLVVFGRTMEVLTNVEKPTWQKLSAPLNQIMSVRYNDPSNHGVIVPSTDTLYSAVLADVSKEPLVLGVPAIPDIPGTNRKRFMMYQFIDAWSNVPFSSGLRQNRVLVPNKANKYSVSSWMNPKIASDGSLTIYLQPTSPGPDLETNWLPSSASIPGVTPLMRLYWPLAQALKGGTWSPPPAVEVT
jgi:hypothetical protein